MIVQDDAKHSKALCETFVIHSKFYYSKIFNLLKNNRSHVMAKRAAGFLIYRLVASDIEYLLLKASYGSFHWTPPKGKNRII